MHPFKLFLTLMLVFQVSLGTAPLAWAEAVDDTFALPNVEGETAKIHGANSGKPLIRILVFGSVPAQGIHYVPEGTDLLFAILYAGGYTEKSNLNGIVIRRRNNASLVEVDLEDNIAAGEAIPKLRDGDIVNVPFNWRKGLEEFQFISSILFSLSTFVLSIVAVTR